MDAVAAVAKGGRPVLLCADSEHFRAASTLPGGYNLRFYLGVSNRFRGDPL